VRGAEPSPAWSLHFRKTATEKNVSSDPPQAALSQLWVSPEDTGMQAFPRPVPQVHKHGLVW
jgi:hypothetical protein